MLYWSGSRYDKNCISPTARGSFAELTPDGLENTPQLPWSSQEPRRLQKYRHTATGPDSHFCEVVNLGSLVHHELGSLNRNYVPALVVVLRLQLASPSAMITSLSRTSDRRQKGRYEAVHRFYRQHCPDTHIIIWISSPPLPSPEYKSCAYTWIQPIKTSKIAAAS